MKTTKILGQSQSTADQKPPKATKVITLDLNGPPPRQEEDITSDDSFDIEFDEIADEDFENIKQPNNMPAVTGP